MSVIPWIIVRDQKELINYETISIKYYQFLSLFFPTLYRNAQRMTADMHFMSEVPATVNV